MRSWLLGLCVGLLIASAAPALQPTSAAAVLALLCVLAFMPLWPLGLEELAGCQRREGRERRDGCGGHRVPKRCLLRCRWYRNCRKSRVELPLAGVSLGLAIGLAHAHQLVHHRLPLECVGETLTVSGSVTGLPERGHLDDGTPRFRFRFVPTEVTPKECVGPRLLLLNAYGDFEFAPGQHWQLDVRLRRPWGPGNWGLADRRAWYAAAGIDAQGSVRSRPEPKRLGEKTTPQGTLHGLRAELSAGIDAQPLPAATRAVLRALVVGDKSGIDASLWRGFQAWGIAHLLVISGLHIGLAAVAGFGAARILQFFLPFVRGQTGVLLGLFVATFYALLAGFTVPVQRSLVMLGVFCIAALLGRRSGSWHNLLLACLFVLLLNPLAAVGVGFWLSFVAVAVLLWLSTWQSRSVVGAALQTHAAMGLCMLPLGAYFFQGASLVAPLANLLLVPLVGLWVVPAALLAATVQIAVPTSATLLWSIAAWPLNQVLLVVTGSLGSFENWLYLHSVSGPWALLVGLAGLVISLVPGGWRHRAIGLVALLCAALPLSSQQQSADDALRISVLDVGQGTAVLVEQGSRALLYDTGGGDPGGNNAARSVVIPSLRRRGIHALDTFVISHGDRDHSAGMADVLAEFPVTRLRRGPLVRLSKGRACTAGEAWRWPGGARFRVLSPAVAGYRGSNNSSCVIQVSWRGRTLLLSGDIERVQERELAVYWRQALAARWLLAPHHGSNTSSSHTFLKHVSPSFLLVGNGYENRFGHPHSIVTARALTHGATLFETARHGAIEVTLHANGREEWQFYRDLYRPHWAQPLHRSRGGSL